MNKYLDNSMCCHFKSLGISEAASSLLKMNHAHYYTRPAHIWTRQQNRPALYTCVRLRPRLLMTAARMFPSQQHCSQQPCFLFLRGAAVYKLTALRVQTLAEEQQGSEVTVNMWMSLSSSRWICLVTLATVMMLSESGRKTEFLLSRMSGLMELWETLAVKATEICMAVY